MGSKDHTHWEQREPIGKECRRDVAACQILCSSPFKGRETSATEAILVSVDWFDWFGMLQTKILPGFAKI